MGTRHQQGAGGFTIIEVLLFLGISGLLAVTLLTGWTTMINTQRYKDSNRTLQSFIQQQYGLVYNVENDRAGTGSCTKNGLNDLTITDAGSDKRGQSDCVLMGRYLYIEDGLVVKVSGIVGTEPDPNDFNSDDQAIKGYLATKSDISFGLSDNELSIPWQATVVGTGGDSTPRSWAIAIVRAPNTGVVHTYSQQVPDGTVPSVLDMVTSANETDVNLCLDAGNPLSGGRMGVLIRAGASAQSAVEVIPDGSGTC
jgi:type II secretory pathway pseudopilin PulG